MDQKELTRKLRRIEIRSRRQTTDILAGEFKSAFRGAGMEFDEVREYLPGDDVRSIDWNVTARQGRPFIKRFHEERELTVFFLVDCSASGRFGALDRSMNDLAAETCATLSFSAVKSNDKVGLMLFTDKIERFIPPAKGSTHAMRIIREVLGFAPSGNGTDMPSAIDYLARVLKRRAVVFIISDFLKCGDFERPLHTLAQKHDVVILPLRDPSLDALEDVGLVEIEDPEGGRRVLVDSGSRAVRQEYSRRISMAKAILDSRLKRCGVDRLPIALGEDYAQKISAFLKRRCQRH